jgi:hypothetical protein
MPNDPWVQLVTACRDFVCGARADNGVVAGAFSEDEFSEFLFAHVPGFDYYGAKEVKEYRTAVFKLLLAFERKGGRLAVARLAIELADHRNGRADATALELLATPFLPGRAGPAPAVGPPTGPAAPAGGLLSPIPAELTALILLLSDEQSGSIDVIAADLRGKLREKSYANCDLPGNLHLSAANGDRLAAILALDAEPHPAYLRWLAERVVVEPPLISFLAAQALTAAAFRLDRMHLDLIIRLTAAVAERLDYMSEPAGVAPRYNLSARKDEIGSARKLAEVRKNKAMPVMSGPDFDRFLLALERFSWQDFADFCWNRLSIRLDRIANPAEPVEIAIVTVVLLVLKRSEAALVNAAYAARPQDATFADIFRKHQAQVVPAVIGATL